MTTPKSRQDLLAAVHTATPEAVQRLVEVAFDKSAPEDLRIRAQALVEYCCVDRPKDGDH